MPKPAVSGAEVLPGPRLAPELSCCLQDPGDRGPVAKPLRRNALGQKLSCCLQDRADAVFGPEHAAAGGSARRRPGAVRDTAASNPDGASAISVGSRSTPGGIPSPRRSSGSDIRRDGGAGSRGCRTPTAPAGISTARRPARRTGIAVRPYGGCRIRRCEVVGRGFRNCCRVRTASWPMAALVDVNTARNAVVLSRHQQSSAVNRGPR